MRKPAIFVTGGAGFIGCSISKALADGELPVVAIDSLLAQVHPSGNAPLALDPRVILERRDVTSDQTWVELLQQWDPIEVVHLAAETGTAQSLFESTRHANVNVVGTTKMLDAISRTATKPRRILVTSSRAVYGEGRWEMENGVSAYAPPRCKADLDAKNWNPRINGDLAVRSLLQNAELTLPNPTSVYGATKLSQEQVVRLWADAMSVSYTVLRLQNVYGVGQSPTNPYTGIINIFHRLAAAGKAIPLYEDGDIGRDFVYIDDVRNAILEALRNPAAENRIFDVGTGQRTTIREAAVAIARFHKAPEPETVGLYRAGDVRSAVADIGAIVDAIGFKPEINFTVGMGRVAVWLKQENML